ncbi:MAG: hemerythrin domain-containing protein [Planctomycetes bacterium]|nr:hemerythrin domain-containing protein [Planctomycetota bacterium]
MPTIDTLTRTITVNPAFLQEIKEAHRELWAVLADCRRLSETPIHGRRRANEFAERLRELCDRLAFHFSLEEAYGYFEEPVRAAPRLVRRCERLRDEHAVLYVDLAQLADLAESRLVESDGADRMVTVQSAFIAFDERFRDHEAAEIELIQSALGDDLGEGD